MSPNDITKLVLVTVLVIFSILILFAFASIALDKPASVKRGRYFDRIILTAFKQALVDLDRALTILEWVGSPGETKDVAEQQQKVVMQLRQKLDDYNNILEDYNDSN